MVRVIKFETFVKRVLLFFYFSLYEMFIIFNLDALKYSIHEIKMFSILSHMDHITQHVEPNTFTVLIKDIRTIWLSCNKRNESSKFFKILE